VLLKKGTNEPPIKRRVSTFCFQRINGKTNILYKNSKAEFDTGITKK
jgi:hypothetical protein